MARKAAAAGPPLSASAQLAAERRKAGLAEAKARQQAQVGFFGDIGVQLPPPDPSVEEPPRDEPPQAGESEVSDAELAEVLAAEALARMAEAASEPSAEDVAALEDYAGADEGDDETLRQQIAEEAERIFNDAPEEASVAAAPPVEEEEPETSASGASSDAAVLPEGVPFEVLTISNQDKEFIDQRSMADVDIQEATAAPGFSLFGENLFGDAIKPKSSGPLAERFTLPPFSILDARQGVWQDRKRAWIALGIQSEVGRGANLIGRSPQELFSHMTGIPYAKAREIVTAAIAERGEAFDLDVLIDEHGRRGAEKGRAFGQDFRLGAQPYTRADGTKGGEGKSWPKKEKEPAATAVSQKLAPGGGGGGCWLGGPKTASTEKFLKSGTSASNKAMEYAGGFAGQSTATSGTSIFDPVLTELVYRWFCPADGFVIDPFAGGSVRGVVASKLGLKYVGIELRPEQILANEAQAEKICAGDAMPPSWLEGDAQELPALTDGCLFDLVMACPPYADLEQYSEDPRDLSNMTYEAFCDAYAAIIKHCVDALKPDRFACYVIGDVRCPDGFYRGLPEFTVKAFEQAGARKYNEAILVTSVGSLPIRVGKQFNAGRKLGKTHQNVYIFVKGDPKRAAEACNGQLELPS